MTQLNVNFQENISRFESAMRKKLLIKSVFYKRIFGGKGFEFDAFRNYSAGDDDSGMIDWKATMRNLGEPLVRQYVEERDLNIFLIIDLGDNMIFGSGEKLKIETASEITSCISHLVVSSGDKIGFTLYNQGIASIRPFSPGMGQFYYLIKNLTDTKNYGGKSSLRMALEASLPYLKKASAVFIISDFIKVDEQDLKVLKSFMARYETIGIMLRDSVDNNLAEINGEVVIEDIDTGQQILIDPDLLMHEYQKNASEQKQKVLEVFKKAGTEVLELRNNEDFVVPLVDFLKKRTKRRKFVRR